MPALTLEIKIEVGNEHRFHGDVPFSELQRIVQAIYNREGVPVVAHANGSIVFQSHDAEDSIAYLTEDEAIRFSSTSALHELLADTLEQVQSDTARAAKIERELASR